MTDETAQRIARQMEACEALMASCNPHERAAARRTFDRLTRRMEERFGQDDATAILDPVGRSSVAVPMLVPWRRTAADAAGVLAGAAFVFWGVRPGRATFIGPASARMVAVHYFEHFERSIDSACRAWRSERRAAGRGVSRRSMADYRLTAARALWLRCERANPHHDERKAHMPPDCTTTPAARVDRRTAGSREGWAAGERVPLSQPVANGHVTLLGIEALR